MESERITVIARSKARPGMEDRLTDAAAGLVAPTRDEEGCINYDLHRSSEDPSEILFYENWNSQEDLDRHLGQPHVKEVLDQLPEISENGVEISIYKMVSTPAS